MFEAICTALALAGLWSLLSLFVLLRTRSAGANDWVRASSTPTFQRQRQICTWAIALICVLLLLSQAWASVTGMSLLLAPSGLFGLHTFLGAGQVYRYRNQISSDRPGDDPCLHGLALAIFWPIWHPIKGGHTGQNQE